MPMLTKSRLYEIAMHDDIEAELADLLERLKFGGTQQQCQELRARIDDVRREIEHRERNIAFTTERKGT
jgi:peptidoglycan hydrolase CwlO-like protein